MTTSALDQAGPAAGWYPDPVEQRSRHHGRRYWDGTGWTATVADGDRVGTDPLPPPVPDTRTALPGRAAWYALAGFLVGQLLAVGGLLLGRRLAPHELAVQLVISEAGLWTGLVGACALASRRWGTGDLRADYALRMQRSDVGRGFVVALAARFASGALLVLLVLLLPRLAGTNSGVFTAALHDRPALIALALLSVIGAPVVEEMFFRGLLLRSLRCRLGVAAAVAVQAVAFGAAHVNLTLGWRNAGVVLGLTVVGAAFGVTAEHYRRLGPSMWAHAWFNLLPAVLLLVLAN